MSIIVTVGRVDVSWLKQPVDEWAELRLYLHVWAFGSRGVKVWQLNVCKNDKYCIRTGHRNLFLIAIWASNIHTDDWTSRHFHLLLWMYSCCPIKDLFIQSIIRIHTHWVNWLNIKHFSWLKILSMLDKFVKITCISCRLINLLFTVTWSHLQTNRQFGCIWLKQTRRFANSSLHNRAQQPTWHNI